MNRGAGTYNQVQEFQGRLPQTRQPGWCWSGQAWARWAERERQQERASERAVVERQRYMVYWLKDKLQGAGGRREGDQVGGNGAANGQSRCQQWLSLLVCCCCTAARLTASSERLRGETTQQACVVKRQDTGGLVEDERGARLRAAVVGDLGQGSWQRSDTRVRRAACFLCQSPGRGRWPLRTKLCSRRATQAQRPL